MVIARATDGGREFLLLGLSAENVRRLQAGEPIRMTPATHVGVPENWTIAIMFGETERAIWAALERDGLIDAAATRVIGVPEGE